MSGSKNATILAAALSSVTDRSIVTYEDYLLKRNEPEYRNTFFTALSIDALHQSTLVGGSLTSDTAANGSDDSSGQDSDEQQSSASGIGFPLAQSSAAATTTTTTTTTATTTSTPASPNTASNPASPNDGASNATTPNATALFGGPQQAQNTVYVRTLQGKTLTIKCSLDNTIAEFKQLIEQQENVPTSRQRLIFAGRQLEDQQTLAQYNILDGYTMHIVVRATDIANTMYFIHSDHLAPRYDYDFTNVTDSFRKFMRGAFEYKRPCGWNRIALRVLNAYGIDNTWLGVSSSTFRYESNASEWPVTYHGTAKHNDCSLADDARTACVGTNFSFNHGIYSTPDVDTAAQYAATFEYEGQQYKVLIQNRVNPSTLQRIPNSADGGGEYWVVPDGESIRPYGICVKRA